MSALWISPHNDDETLFGAYTLMRYHPVVLVVTDSYIQFERGDGITAEQRRQETLAAMRLLGCPVVWGGIRDADLNEYNCRNLFESFENFDRVYAPMVQGGNVHHDIIGTVAAQMFPNLIRYPTYTKTELWTPEGVSVIPEPDEIILKNKALDCYQSQINLPSTRPHFDAVRNKCEWLVA